MEIMLDHLTGARLISPRFAERNRVKRSLPPVLPSHAFKLIATDCTGRHRDIECYDVMCSGMDAVARSGRATAAFRDAISNSSAILATQNALLGFGGT